MPNGFWRTACLYVFNYNCTKSSGRTLRANKTKADNQHRLLSHLNLINRTHRQILDDELQTLITLPLVNV
ncbi:hypothetical protein [Moraxella lacunata]|uniref:hypothetical protein n=1 Tax=Moraxella lacunata TaxID=477 RepID=UPI003EDF3C2B